MHRSQTALAVTILIFALALCAAGAARAAPPHVDLLDPQIDAVEEPAPPPEADVVTSPWRRGLEQGAPEQQRYVRVTADEAAGSAQNAFWAFTAGFFVHGTGHFLSGDRDVALALLLAEAAGLVLWTGGYVAESLSGESGMLAPFTRPIKAVGLAAFVASWQLDLLGSFSGKAGTARYEAPPPNPIIATAYYTLWSDPRQSHLNLFSLGLQLPAQRAWQRLDRLQLGVMAAWDFFAASEPLALDLYARLRLWGDEGEQATQLSLTLDWTEEWRAGHGYHATTPLAAIEARYLLEGALPRFRHVVLLGRWGYGVETLRYGEDPGAWSLQGDRNLVTIGEMGMILPLMRTGRMDLRWRLLNDRLLSSGEPGRAPYHVGFHFQVGGSMDMLLSLNMGHGFDGWIGLAYRYY